MEGMVRRRHGSSGGMVTDQVEWVNKAVVARRAYVPHKRLSQQTGNKSAVGIRDRPPVTAVEPTGNRTTRYNNELVCQPRI